MLQSLQVKFEHVTFDSGSTLSIKRQGLEASHAMVIRSGKWVSGKILCDYKEQDLRLSKVEAKFVPSSHDSRGDDINLGIETKIHSQGESLEPPSST